MRTASLPGLVWLLEVAPAPLRVLDCAGMAVLGMDGPDSLAPCFAFATCRCCQGFTLGMGESNNSTLGGASFVFSAASMSLSALLELFPAPLALLSLLGLLESALVEAGLD